MIRLLCGSEPLLGRLDLLFERVLILLAGLREGGLGADTEAAGELVSHQLQDRAGCLLFLGRGQPLLVGGRQLPFEGLLLRVDAAEDLDLTEHVLMGRGQVVLLHLLSCLLGQAHRL